MGSAFTFPLAENGNDVRLWGTWLDDEIIERTRRGNHPKLNRPLHPAVRLYASKEIEPALDGIDVLVVATSSDGFVPVLSHVIPVTPNGIPIVSLTKGFAIIDETVCLLSAAIRQLSNHHSYGAIGGPVKAVELAMHIPSVTVIAAPTEVSDSFAPYVQTPYYTFLRSEDVTGLEVSVALKNVYAIALGICDGIFTETHGDLFHNFPAALFSRSVAEIAAVVHAAGGNVQTAYGLGGIGDLHVTARSGKNREFGMRIGRGARAMSVYNEMLREGKQAEGYLALRAASAWIRYQYPGLYEHLPLFRTLDQIVFGNTTDTKLALMSVLRYPEPEPGALGSQRQKTDP